MSSVSRQRACKDGAGVGYLTAGSRLNFFQLTVPCTEETLWMEVFMGTKSIHIADLADFEW